MITVGESAILVHETSKLDAATLFRLLRDSGLPGVRDLVAGAQTVLVIFDDEAGARWTDLSSVLEETGRFQLERLPRSIEIPVRYDGPDLGAVAARAGLSEAEVIARHSAAHYHVAFVGFQPGFAYLRGLPAELATPRRDVPRARVPKGSVAIGASYSGVYPAASPGGWNLIGTTDSVLFDAHAEPPSLLSAGDQVRFVAVRP